MPVTDRRGMAQLLNERMQKSYTLLKERQELEPDTSLVKTYMIEAHLPETAGPDRATAVARLVFERSRLAQTYSLRIFETEDPHLLQLDLTRGSEGATVYVDFTSPRFWLLHSMGSSKFLGEILRRLVAAGPDLDRVWLPAQLLEKITTLGSFRGLSLWYDRRWMADDDPQDLEAPVAFLKMQLWGNRAGRVLRILRKERAFPNETTLSKVKVKYELSPEDEDSPFSIDDIRFDGKITARGNSFQTHTTLVSIIYNSYARKLRELESDYAIRTEKAGDGVSLLGEPINFLFRRPIPNLQHFCDRVFSGSEPFRLWGVPTQRAADYFRVNAVDLHVGQRVQVEIAPRFIRYYLPAGSCANSVVRLFTNLQRHHDSLVEAVNGRGEAIFGF